MKGSRKLILGKYRPKVMWVNFGIVVTPLFSIDIPLSNKSIQLRAKFPGSEADDEIELAEVLRPMSLTVVEDLCC